MPLIIVGPRDIIITANTAAVSMGFAEGEPVNKYLVLEEQDLATELIGAPATKLWRFSFSEREKICHLSSIQTDIGIYCWLTDLSEQLALAERLRTLKDPAKKQLLQIKNQAATAIGYAELLEVIMDGKGRLSADQITLIRRYQSEVRNSLQRIQQIALDGGFADTSVKNSILLVEGHEALNELITELLISEGYKVTSFLDTRSALEYFRVNRYSVQTAIVAENSNSAGGKSLSSALKEIAPALSIITLSATPDLATGLAIRKPLDFQQLLELLKF